MIQASNELILGIELNEEYAQLTYFHPSVKEPLTLSFEPDAENYLLPVAMRKPRVENGNCGTAPGRQRLR